VAERLRRIQSVADAALAHLDLDDLLGELLVRIRDALEGDTCAVLLLDEAGRELVARAARGLEEEVERGVRIPVGKGFAGRVVAEKRPIVIDDLDRADVVNPILREKGIKSMLGVPLLVHGDAIGVLHVGTLTPRQFTQDDVELLQLAGDRAALAIEHGRAYEA
jgi:GAF domain-containing protein